VPPPAAPVTMATFVLVMAASRRLEFLIEFFARP
jgi:hypothetical protein